MLIISCCSGWIHIDRHLGWKHYHIQTIHYTLFCSPYLATHVHPTSFRLQHGSKHQYKRFCPTNVLPVLIISCCTCGIYKNRHWTWKHYHIPTIHYTVFCSPYLATHVHPMSFRLQHGSKHQYKRFVPTNVLPVLIISCCTGGIYKDRHLGWKHYHIPPPAWIPNF